MANLISLSASSIAREYWHHMAWTKGGLGDNSAEVCSDVFQMIVSDIFPDIVYLMKYLLYGQAGKNMLEEQKMGKSFYSKIYLEANVISK